MCVRYIHPCTIKEIKKISKVYRSSPKCMKINIVKSGLIQLRDGCFEKKNLFIVKELLDMMLILSDNFVQFNIALRFDFIFRM